MNRELFLELFFDYLKTQTDKIVLVCLIVYFAHLVDHSAHAGTDAAIQRELVTILAGLVGCLSGLITGRMMMRKADNANGNGHKNGGQV